MSHGAVKFLLRIIEAIFLLVLVGAAVFAWRLSQGPIAIDGVAPYLAEAFTDISQGVKFQVEHLEFKWPALTVQPELTARNVRLLDSSGGVIAGLPSMVVRLSPTALLRGVVAPDMVALSNPIIRFVHRPDGSLGLGEPVASPAAGPGNAAAPNASASAPVPQTEGVNSNVVAEALIRSLTHPASPDNRAGYLDTVTIDSTTLVLVDEVSSQRWIVPDATLTFHRVDGNLDLQATLPVVEEGRRWNLTAKGRFSEATNTLSIGLDMDGLRPARIAKLAPQLAPLAMVDLLVSGTASANLSLHGGVARLDHLQFDVKGQAGKLHLPAPIDHDYPIKSLSLKGSAEAGLDHITVDQLRLEFDRGAGQNPVVVASAEGTTLDSAPHVSLRADVADLSLAALKDYWPEGVKAGTRSWIAQNLTQGGLSNTELRVNLSGGALDKLEASGVLLTSHLHDVAVTYMEGMPQVVGADGMMTLTPNQVFIALSAGHVPDEISGKGLVLKEGTIRLHGLGGSDERAELNLDIGGEFGEAMRLVDHAPLGYAHSMGIDPTQVVGLADVNLALDFPLVSDLKRDQINIAVKASTRGVGIPNVAFGLPLNQGQFDLSLNPDGMQVNGTANLGGIASAISWHENFGDGPVRSTYILDPTLDNVQRPLVGLDRPPFIPPYMDGPVHTHVVYVLKRDHTAIISASGDLVGTAMAIPELGWHKAAGDAASGTVIATLNDDHLVALPAFHVTSDGLDVVGQVTFDADGGLKTLTIAPSSAGETKLAGTVSHDESGYTVDVNGAAFNSTYFWRELSRDEARGVAAKPAPSESPPLKLKASFDRMWLTKDADFRDVQLSLERDHAGIQALDFKSKVSGVPFTLALTPAGDGKRSLTGSSANGGGVVRAIGLFRDLVGGKLSVKGEVAANGAVKGVAQIKDFKLIDAPPLARLLSVAALTGILDELQGKGISFKTLRTPFTYGNSTITIADGEMFGSSLGLTGNGTYNFNTDMMDFNGTLIPAYAINSVLNSIPVIGNILSGGDKGGGIFAATYSYRGDVATAQPSVNPLAALTPGFLRHIFDIFKPNHPKEAAPQQAEQKAEAPSPSLSANTDGG